MKHACTKVSTFGKRMVRFIPSVNRGSLFLWFIHLTCIGLTNNLRFVLLTIGLARATSASTFLLSRLAYRRLFRTTINLFLLRRLWVVLLGHVVKDIVFLKRVVWMLGRGSGDDLLCMLLWFTSSSCERRLLSTGTGTGTAATIIAVSVVSIPEELEYCMVLAVADEASMFSRSIASETGACRGSFHASISRVVEQSPQQQSPRSTTSLYTTF